jgi:hypothetical protein
MICIRCRQRFPREERDHRCDDAISSDHQPRPAVDEPPRAVVAVLGLVAILVGLVLGGQAHARDKSELRHELTEELPGDCFVFYTKDRSCKVRGGKATGCKILGDIDRSKPECARGRTKTRVEPVRKDPCLKASVSVKSGVERWAEDTARIIDLDKYYKPYPKQQRFHRSKARYKGFGGAAGPGKSAALILDQVMSCYEHEGQDALKVQTLLLRRTHPQLAGSLIPRFRSLVPPELYKSATLDGSKKQVVWLNNARTIFGSMQHDKNVWDYQGGEYKEIDFDEATQFTFYQWNTIGAWNRCPVGFARQSGATNPVGIGADWFRRLFVQKRPAAEMDASQKAAYRAADYDFIPALVKDNPTYAKDPNFLATLAKYPLRLREALLRGRWDVALGAYYDCWDEATMVYPADSLERQPWWPIWMGGDWGFEHNSAIYWYTTLPDGTHRIYRELVVNHHSPKQLAEKIVEMSIGPDGKLEIPSEFHFSHDAHNKREDENTIALQMDAVFHKAHRRWPATLRATTDKVGSEQLLYDELQQLHTLVSSACPELINIIPTAPRAELHPEEIADFLGDDPIAGARLGLYGRIKRAGKKPTTERVKAELAKLPAEAKQDPTLVALATEKALAKVTRPRISFPRRWRPQA